VQAQHAQGKIIIKFKEICSRWDSNSTHVLFMNTNILLLLSDLPVNTNNVWKYRLHFRSAVENMGSLFGTVVDINSLTFTSKQIHWCLCVIGIWHK
jgi:uncharacterized membrane protein